MNLNKTALPSNKFQLIAVIIGTSVLFSCNATDSSSTAAVNIDSSKTSSIINTKTIEQKTLQIDTRVLEQAAPVSLTMEQIMSDPDWLGRQPENAYFSADGDSILYSRKREGAVVRDLFITSANQGNGIIVEHQDRHLYDYDVIVDDQDFDFVGWIHEGNVFAQNKQTKKVTQLTKSSDRAFNLSYYKKTGLSYQQGSRFYAVDVNTGKQEQLFEWYFGKAPTAVDAPKDYIAKEQIKLIKYIQVQRKNKQDRFEFDQKVKQENPSHMVSTFYFNKSDTNVAASVSPDGKYAIVVTRENTPTRSDTDIMPHYIQEDGRIAAQAVRKRVADAEPQAHDIHFLDLRANTQKRLSYKALPGVNEDVLASVKAENATRVGKTYTPNRLPREVRLLSTQSPIKWHDSSSHVALMLEAWDNKDRWIVTVDVEKPQLTNQHRAHDKAWINYRFNQFAWFDNSLSLWLLSEESGYSQLYTKALDGDLKAITQGNFVVDDVVLTKDDRYFYYTANKKHPGIYEIYRRPSEGGNATALTDLNGKTEYVLSPNENELVLTHSKLTMPPELYTVTVDDAVTESVMANKLTNTVSPEFLSIPWTSPSIVAIESSHTERPIYSRVYLPEQTDSNEKRRAVVFTHGAGYLQNAHLGWSGYFREFMFHSLLVSKGYVVLDMDYRASAGYGRDWRTAIYRQMGTPEVEDLKDGVRWLVDNANVDEGRIGTYGGSYGGFLTFMSLFNEPELFQAGAALRPVSDWAHYNLGYTSNILNTPNVDPIAYERSSPIYFAEGLNKPLLINAPMVDNNVFFVDVVRLVQRLIELEKENFETAIYPVEPHGFVQPSSWLDEYRRIFKLFETHL
ncbi:S9 family peptidase [Glaciecola petra]|uniref:Prolyl oligopeptidase family serine peptidase n=1 Tax=Glaciecola petra TaxID=3075602 RepID=A0ABU2ZQ03_9ALTE|nr:prolyl oligopeptidase family serine peptidase [Aestuariibacter sp. P117]MDT0594356.1 prolyl oligopeptidase family serine peptidase [Aestuariibacter sp. P117]